MKTAATGTRSDKEINRQIKARVGDLLAMGNALGLADLKGTPRKISFRCPLHGGCSAGASIKDGEPVWHCFGCDEGGDYFSLVVAATGLVDWPQIRETAARIAGVNLPSRGTAYDGPFPDANQVRIEDLIWLDNLLAAVARMDLVDPMEEGEDAPDNKAKATAKVEGVPKEVAEPEVAEPEVAEPEVAEPEVAEPEVAEPAVAAQDEPVVEDEAEAPAAPAPAAPPARAAEYAALWERCMRLDDPQIPNEVLAYLRGRALPPAVLLGATPAQDLVRVLPQDIPLPSWAAREGVAWSASKHRVIVRIYDPLARLAGLRARSVDPDCPAGAKEMVGAGVKLSGTVLVDAPGELVLRLGPEKMGNALKTTRRQLVVLIAEGVPDFLTLAIWAKRWRATPAAASTVLAVFGVYAGGWTQSVADRLPTGARVIIRNHSDKGGCGYRDEIAETLWARRCAVEVRHPDGLPTTKKFPDENDDLKRFGLDGIDPLDGNTHRPAPPRGGWRFSDTGLGERLIHYHGADLRYCPAWGKWMAWDGTRWDAENQLEVERRAVLSARSIGQVEAARAKSSEAREALEAWSLKAENDGWIGKTIHRARALREVEVRPADLDADPWILNCTNGALDLRSGRFLPSARNLLVTKQAGTAYNPRAQAPIWERVLGEVFGGNQNLIDCLRRAVGYSLTGIVREQVCFFAVGPGGAGKGTVFNALRDALGSYAQACASTVAINRKKGEHPADLARLCGARFVLASEVAKGARVTEEVFKNIVSEDAIPARFMGGNWFEYEPTHKLWFMVNDLPVVEVDDDAAWRRIFLFPFDQNFRDRKDTQLKAKLTEEREGILLWAIKGCREWLERGELAPPPEVLARKEQAKRDVDDVADFLDAECEVGIGFRVLKKGLYQAYSDWCGRNGARPASAKAFGQKVEHKGFGASKSNGLEYRTGLRLRPFSEEAAAPFVPRDALDALDALVGLA